ncbi:hypothetical protein [Longimicrobium terrae]|uniref:DUF4276 family protein n=1 Tax=Longimicrobium terrae TaxID=1639882 RepID=A0A841H264_9BACT|nr:hypothetical protein [Longimicrobium terrae]MBB4637988.1 hypothetical protein [Longimicrobium terrae]MBB6072235.1 hypothetical protein [Longimicrobium terrae]NNC28344.1 hypothetical protein [Longimicrobium terrae]
MISVVVGGEAEHRLVQALLADLMEEHGVSVRSGSSADDARPFARQIMIEHPRPVAFVINADSTNPQRVRETQSGLKSYFRPWARCPFLVMQFEPEAETIYFERPAILERLLGRALDPVVVAAGRAAPKRVLEVLAGSEARHLVDRLTEDDLRELRATAAITRLRNFVRTSALAAAA